MMHTARQKLREGERSARGLQIVTCVGEERAFNFRNAVCEDGLERMPDIDVFMPPLTIGDEGICVPGRPSVR